MSRTMGSPSSVTPSPPSPPLPHLLLRRQLLHSTFTSPSLTHLFPPLAPTAPSPFSPSPPTRGGAFDLHASGNISNESFAETDFCSFSGGGQEQERQALLLTSLGPAPRAGSCNPNPFWTAEVEPESLWMCYSSV